MPWLEIRPGGYRGEMDERDEVRRRLETLTVALSVRSIPRVVGSLHETTLTIQQLKTLAAVVVNESATVSGLSDLFGVSLATMSKLVERLVEQGLLDRVQDGGDQRVRRLRPTDRARAAVREILGARPELGRDVLDALSLEELRALETGMRAINRELQKRGS